VDFDYLRGRGDKREVILIMDISVIVPTRNRVESLRNLISSIEEAASPGGTNVEIIIVNNGSTDQTSEMLQENLGRSRGFAFRVLDQPRPGKSNALNLGLFHAKGDILMILDDDVTVHPGCFSSHIQAYESTKFAAIQGKVLPGTDTEGRPADPSRLREYNIPLIDYGDHMTEIRGLTGTNMSFKREVLDRVGLFDVRLGPGASGFSEDTEFSVRIRKAGFKIGYTPLAVVYHELNPTRYGGSYNRDVEYRKGLSRSIYRSDSIVFRVIPNLVINCIRYGLYKILGRTRKAYKTEGRIMKCWGYLVGKRARWQRPS
jgi:GT2 family glycosyltransferase